MPRIDRFRADLERERMRKPFPLWIALVLGLASGVVIPVAGAMLANFLLRGTFFPAG